jgi:hypothetical protein
MVISAMQQPVESISPFRQHLDATGAETLIAFLAGRFHVKAPRLSISRRRNTIRGTYRPSQQRIRVSPNTQTWVVAHEFAHYLDHVVNPGTKGHTISFYRNLLNVIAEIGETASYPWNEEYAVLRRWAKRDGIFYGQAAA